MSQDEKMIDELKDKIENERDRLNKAVYEDLTSLKTLIISEELDVLINEYHKEEDF